MTDLANLTISQLQEAKQSWQAKTTMSLDVLMQAQRKLTEAKITHEQNVKMYQKIDLELAMKDGRFERIKAKKPNEKSTKVRKKKDPKKITVSDINKLIAGCDSQQKNEIKQLLENL